MFIYREGCTYTPDFLARLKEACPDAKVTTEIGEGGKIIETNCYFIHALYTFACINLLNVKLCYILECWEFFINEKCVHSRKLLYGSKFPDVDEMIEISEQMYEVINSILQISLIFRFLIHKNMFISYHCYSTFQGRSFMHMYLCTFMEGGVVNMVKEDKKKTPLAKRAILACTIQ